MEKMKVFNGYLRNAALNNSDSFVFEGEEYPVVAFNGLTQTLIGGRILYRIYIDENKDSNNIMLEAN
jgi:hypothetical protein